MQQDEKKIAIEFQVGSDKILLDNIKVSDPAACLVIKLLKEADSIEKSTFIQAHYEDFDIADLNKTINQVIGRQRIIKGSLPSQKIAGLSELQTGLASYLHDKFSPVWRDELIPALPTLPTYLEPNFDSVRFTDEEKILFDQSRYKELLWGIQQCCPSILEIISKSPDSSCSIYSFRCDLLRSQENKIPVLIIKGAIRLNQFTALEALNPDLPRQYYDTVLSILIEENVKESIISNWLDKVEIEYIRLEITPGQSYFSSNTQTARRYYNDLLYHAFCEAMRHKKFNFIRGFIQRGLLNSAVWKEKFTESKILESIKDAGESIDISIAKRILVSHRTFAEQIFTDNNRNSSLYLEWQAECFFEPCTRLVLIPLLNFSLLADVIHIVAGYAAAKSFYTEENLSELTQEKVDWLKPLKGHTPVSEEKDSLKGNQIGWSHTHNIFSLLLFDMEYLSKEFWKDELISCLKTYRRHGFKLDNPAIYAACVKMVGEEAVEQVFPRPPAAIPSRFLPPPSSTSSYSLSSFSGSIFSTTTPSSHPPSSSSTSFHSLG